MPAPNVAYVWATFDRGGVTASGASGLADPGRGRALTIDDPVRIASISKLVMALGVMRLVEDGQIDLDRDVSDYLGWSLRNPAFPDRPITLRLLLSHRSSLTDNVDYAVPLGTEVRAVAGSPAAFDAAHPPGAYFRYSNLNFPVIASALERVTGERFDRLMARLVLQPLGLDACFNWSTCSDAAIARAVVLRSGGGQPIRDDLGGRPPDCAVNAPEGSSCDLSNYVLGSNGALFSPQGGLRISARDLAVVGRLLLHGGTHQGQRFVSEASIRMLLAPVWTFDGANGEIDSGFYCAYGLASQSLPVRTAGCRDDLFGRGRAVAGHAGDAYGLRSGLWVDPASGTGIAYFSVGNGDDPPRGRSAYRAIEEWLARKLRP
ncbi:serine hydrolase [Sphingosinicella sp. LHD-64]|uniref:serine hydrolase domain-containing protein n=1 Tax=Sphingosinicella sp. LHD-64 TaxID=3072139 RepID=UPI00280E234C|nr:serine hydrolase [Sphingosinicella sp. LHD-64]MDQ8756426.1 serine hydrolase [Sphingosinicella sp. LHD-64]